MVCSFLLCPLLSSPSSCLPLYSSLFLSIPLSSSLVLFSPPSSLTLPDIALSLFLTFKRMRSLKATEDSLAQAVLQSPFLELNPARNGIRRNTPLPALPPDAPPPPLSILFFISLFYYFFVFTFLKKRNFLYFFY